MMKSLERSLKRLGTDHIDLYYLHMWDYMTPVEEVARGLDDLVRQGRVHYVAFSDTPAWIVAEANTRAELMGWSRFVGMQVPYSLLRRDVERAILPMARHWELAVLPWGLLQGGILTGKFTGAVREATRLDPEKLDLSERALGVVQEVEKVAREAGRSINWVRQQGHRAQMIPILGARSKKQLRDNLSALEWELSPEQLKRLDEASAIEMGFPHDFLEGNHYIFGATFDQIDVYRK